MENCIFCKIVKGELPSYKVWEDENHLAFLTINPFKEGHTLVIPKEHISYIFDIEDQKLGELMGVNKKVADMLLKTFKPRSGKVGIVVAGDEVPHAHIHLIPFDSVSDLSFTSAKPASQEELASTLKKLTSNY